MPAALLSSWHRNVTPASVSLKLKLALVWVVGFAGVDVITGAGGGVVSMVQVKLVGPLWLPLVSCALTEKV